MGDYEVVVGLLTGSGMFHCDQITYAHGTDPQWVRGQMEGRGDVDFADWNTTSIGNQLFCYRHAAAEERRDIGLLLLAYLGWAYESVCAGAAAAVPRSASLRVRGGS